MNQNASARARAEPCFSWPVFIVHKVEISLLGAIQSRSHPGVTSVVRRDWFFTSINQFILWGAIQSGWGDLAVARFAERPCMNSGHGLIVNLTSWGRDLQGQDEIWLRVGQISFPPSNFTSPRRGHSDWIATRLTPGWLRDWILMNGDLLQAATPPASTSTTAVRRTGSACSATWARRTTASSCPTPTRSTPSTR